MADQRLDVARDLIVAWIGAWSSSAPEPREVAEAFKVVHRAICEAGGAKP